MKSPLKLRLEAQHQLERHQLNMEEGSITPDNLEQETTLKCTLHTACILEEDYWRKKYRSLLLKSCDMNTTYFHKQAEAHKQVSYVKEIHLQD